MKDKINIPYDSLLSKMNKTVKNLGLNYSQNRDFILHVLYDSDEHLSVDEITNEVNKRFSQNLSKTTIYNTINFFEELNLIHSLSLLNESNKKTYYELSACYHHDHLICEKCHKIIEFFDLELENHQDEISKKHNFIVFSHSLLLYGVCEDCQK